MSSETPNPLSDADTEREAEAVARYLDRHPDFFVGREELLRKLSLPHESGSAVSLLERQITLLRQRNEELDARMKEFMATANDNDALFEKTRLTILELLKAGTVREIAGALEREIPKNFEAAATRLLLITDEPGAAEDPACPTHEQTRQALGSLFEKKRTFCEEVDDDQAAFLFPGADRPIASVAVVPVHTGPVGEFGAFPVLVIGSADPQYFNNSQDTLFLDFIGEVLAGLITRVP